MDQNIINKYQKKIETAEGYKSLINSFSETNIYKIINNSDFIQGYDDTFSNILDINRAVTHQKKSGRCWLFSFTNLLRHHMIQKWGLPQTFELSQNYLFFYDKLERSRYFLEIIYELKDLDITSQSIKYFFDKPITDGGFWNMAVNLVEKYGIVPKSVMKDTYQSENTKQMNYFINLNLREFSYLIRKHQFTPQEFETFLNEKIFIIYKLLVYFLGKPPKTFDWNYYIEKNKQTIKKTHSNLSPLEYYKTYVDFNPDDYTILLNLPLKQFPYFQKYEMKYCNNMLKGTPAEFINIPIKLMSQLCKKSIDQHQPVWFGADIHHYFNRDKGIADLNTYDYSLLRDKESPTLDKGDRLLFNQSVPNHAMLIFGYDINTQHQIVKWFIENSWGNKKANKGFVYMSKEWFDHYVFEIVVKKNILSPKLLKAVDQKQIHPIYPWKIITCEALCVN